MWQRKLSERQGSPSLAIRRGAVASHTTQRAFEYYGVGVDMRQIAQLTEADPESGTNPLLMAKALDRIDYRFKTHLVTIMAYCLGTCMGKRE